MNYDTAQQLVRQIEQSEECREYKRLKEIVEESDTTRALLKAYRRSQMMLQMASLGGSQMPQEEMTRFSQLSSLLYAGTDTSAYLLAEMRLQQMMADIFAMLTKAAGISMELPGVQ
ncbi:MAG: YlbF family regulator [Christensenellales bacterium]